MNKTINWPRVLQVTAFTFALLVSAGAKQMHRWVDPQGNVHYSDQPPPANARDARTMSGSGTRASDDTDESDDTDDTDGTPSYVDQETEFQERQVMKAEAEAKKRKEAEETDATKRNCDAARSHAQTLAAGGRITRRNAQGELEFLDDAQISEQLIQANQKVKQWCDS